MLEQPGSLLGELGSLLARGILADASTTDIAILSAISMGGGYVLLAGLWYFVFRDKSSDNVRQDKRKEP